MNRIAGAVRASLAVVQIGTGIATAYATGGLGAAWGVSEAALGYDEYLDALRQFGEDNPNTRSYLSAVLDARSVNPSDPATRANTDRALFAINLLTGLGGASALTKSAARKAAANAQTAVTTASGAPSQTLVDSATEILESAAEAGGRQLAPQDGIPTAFARELDGGGSWLMTNRQYDQFVRGRDLIGRPEGQFMTSATRMNQLIQETAGDPVMLGRRLGVNWEPGTTLIRIDVRDPLLFNPRLPDASISGANALFRPGGLTAGGIPEVVTDQLPWQQVWPNPIIIPRQ